MCQFIHRCCVIDMCHLIDRYHQRPYSHVSHLLFLSPHVHVPRCSHVTHTNASRHPCLSSHIHVCVSRRLHVWLVHAVLESSLSCLTCMSASIERASSSWPLLPASTSGLWRLPKNQLTRTSSKLRPISNRLFSIFCRFFSLYLLRFYLLGFPLSSVSISYICVCMYIYIYIHMYTHIHNISTSDCQEYRFGPLRYAAILDTLHPISWYIIIIEVHTYKHIIHEYIYVCATYAYP